MNSCIYLTVTNPISEFEDAVKLFDCQLLMRNSLVRPDTTLCPHHCQGPPASTLESALNGASVQGVVHRDGIAFAEVPSNT